jgi:hypothetical protein
VPSDELDGERGDRPPEGPPGELFYRGTLIRLLRGSGAGVVRSASSGREIPFEMQHVALPGGPADPRLELREGMQVGYDVGWTSRGLRVTKLFPLA